LLERGRHDRNFVGAKYPAFVLNQSLKGQCRHDVPPHGREDITPYVHVEHDGNCRPTVEGLTDEECVEYARNACGSPG